MLVLGDLIVFMVSELVGKNYKSMIGGMESYRLEFARQYHKYKSEIALEKLPKDQKLNLWNESLTYCPNDRLGWCEAVRFFEIATELQK